MYHLFSIQLRVILLYHILSSLCHLTVTGWHLFSPSPSSAWSALRLTLLPDLICDICRTVSKQGIKLYHNINYQCLLFLFHYSKILLSDESQNWQSYTRPSESWILDLYRWDLPQAETLIDLTTKIKAQQGENLSDLCDVFFILILYLKSLSSSIQI